MSIPTLQMIGFGPPVDKRGKPTGSIAVESDRRSWATIRNYWYAQNEWHHELLFYIGNMFDHLMGISPNYRYWWHSAHRLYYARIGEKKYRPLTDDWERYKCVFSPDSRYLAGVAIGVMILESILRGTTEVPFTLWSVGCCGKWGSNQYPFTDLQATICACSWGIRPLHKSRAR